MEKTEESASFYPGRLQFGARLGRISLALRIPFGILCLHPRFDCSVDFDTVTVFIWDVSWPCKIRTMGNVIG